MSLLVSSVNEVSQLILSPIVGFFFFQPGSYVWSSRLDTQPHLRWFLFITSALLNLAFSPGSVIVYFILYFKTAVTAEKGIENLRVAVSSTGTFGDFQAKNLVLISDKSTKSTTTTGIKGLRIPLIDVIGLDVSFRFHSLSLAFSLSSLPFIAALPSTSFCETFSQRIFQ